MRGTALAALNEADVVLYLVDGTEGPPAPLADRRRARRPLRARRSITALNKVRSARRRSARAICSSASRAPMLHFRRRPATASTTLLARLGSLLPESPFLYPEDEISTQTVRFFVSELVRETALEQLDDEVPYSVACEIEEFRESQIASVHSCGPPRRARQPETNSHRRRRAARPRDRPGARDRRSKRSSARRSISTCGSRCCRTGAATRMRCTGSATSYSRNDPSHEGRPS